MNKENIKIVLTDSGLGGLSVAADLVEKLKTGRYFRKAEITFFDCRPSHNIGYDTMETNERRQRVFNRAMHSMAEKLTPDLIMIACNTLSVFYEKTDYHQNPPVPVMDIVDTGVNEIADYYQVDGKSNILLFGTPTTTTRYQVHKEKLMAKGIPEEKLIYQNCPHLANALEGRPDVPQAEKLINQYTAEVLEKFASPTDPFVLCLLCTHFGYAIDQFLQGFKIFNTAPQKVIDPNPQMNDDFLQDIPAERFAESEVDIKVLTQTGHPPESKTVIYNLINKTSSQTAEALENATLIPDFYDIS